jgi:hypothetical protein
MKKYLLILFVLFAYTIKGQVSNVHLSFGSTGVVHPSNVNEGDMISFSFWMVNRGNIPLDSSIEMIIAVEDSASSPVSYTTSSLGSFVDVDSVLSPNDSIFIVIWDYVSSARYGLGDNIVVIWPNFYTPYPSTSDEFTGMINVSTLSSVAQKQSDVFSIFPNPIIETATLKTVQPISTFKMIDILGNVVRYAENVQDNFMAIHKNELKIGIYFVEIKTGNNTQIKKVIFK